MRNPNSKKLFVWEDPWFASVIALNERHAMEVLHSWFDEKGFGGPEGSPELYAAKPTKAIDLGASWASFQAVTAPLLRPDQVWYPDRQMTSVNLLTKELTMKAGETIRH